jgi:hypothetical protein
MQCKVKIGCSYEPKWFEYRKTQGTYSAKNIPADIETAWLQQALLGGKFKRHNYAGWVLSAVVVAGLFFLSYI